MFVFGHIGITIGIFLIAGYLFPRIRPDIDYRYVAFGALLPDIIDKPIGRVLFAESIANGRIIAHTLIFCILLFLLGYYLYNSKVDTRVLIIAGASLCHLLEDLMWTQPTTFFWPVCGWDFPYKGGYGNGAGYLFAMFSKPFSPDLSIFLILEFIGLTIIVLMLILKFRKSGFMDLISRTPHP